MFAAHAKRVAVERVNAVKDAIVTGIWGNPNYDEGTGVRESVLRDVDERFGEVIRSIYSGDEPEIDKSDPFFAAMKIPEIDSTVPPEVIEALEKRAQGKF